MPGATRPRNWGLDKSLSFGDTKLTPEDLQLLEAPNWLNDNILAFWTEYLETHAMPGLQARGAVLLSPQVVQLVRGLPEDQVPLILESHNMASKNLWILPINDCQVQEAGGSHWSLLVYRRGRNFEHYDSMCGALNQDIAQEVAHLLARTYKLENKGTMEKGPCLKQTNTYDCGIHVMCNIRAVCLQLLLDSELSVAELATKEVIDGARGELTRIITNMIKEQHRL